MDVIRLVKNPKHNSAITSPPKPDLYSFAISQKCQSYLSSSLIPDYLLVMKMSKL